MLAKKMSNLLVLNDEKAMGNPFTDVEDQVGTNMWYLDIGVSNHMAEDRAKLRELNEKFIGNMKFYNGSIVTIQDKWFTLFQCKNTINV